MYIPVQQKTISEIFQWIVKLRISRTLPLFFIMTPQSKHWKHDEAQLSTYDVIMKNNGKMRDVRSLACKIKVLNDRVQGTWKWTIKFLLQTMDKSTKLDIQRKNWHSQRGPRWGACQFDLDLWPFDPKIYRCLPFFILHLCMKYEVSRSNTFRVIALQRKCGQTDRRTEGQTDGQTDKVITIGLPHLRWRGPNKYMVLLISFKVHRI